MRYVRDVSRRSVLALGSLTSAGALAACGNGRGDNGRGGGGWRPNGRAYKPVLSIYPEAEAALDVALAYDGQLTYCYPQPRQEGTSAVWSVTAAPDGTLTDPSGRTYPSLFWEGIAAKPFEQTEGFVVTRDRVTGLLEDMLGLLGLTDREAAEFITFWVPRIEQHERSLLTFAADQHSQVARYTFTDPGSGASIVPDVFVRVYLLVGEVPDQEVPEQTLASAPPRTGLTAVEWGGSDLRGT